MIPHLLFVHGWAFDANIWGGVRSRLGDPEATVWERGYFEEPGVHGARSEPDPPPGPYIAVGHSFGVMRLLRERPKDAVGFVSVCGFSRFTADAGFPGTQQKVLDRMVARMKLMPATVLGEFRGRCGASATVFYGVQTERLTEDLIALRDGDERAAAAALDIPVLSLVAEADAIVPPAQSAASFPQAETHVLNGVGHLLPQRAPDWCAARIGEFAARIAKG